MTPILYDSLLVHYLAQALHDRYAGQRLRELRFDSQARRLVLDLGDERLVWELHPTRGWLRRTATGPTLGEGWSGRPVRTQRRPRIRRVHAPPDERRLEIDLDAGGPQRASRVVVELMSNQWNALALDPAGTIVAVVWSRQAGDRQLRTGTPYEPPRAQPRAGHPDPVSPDRFRTLVQERQDRPSDLEPTQGPRRALLRSLAWVSSLNVDAILGNASADGDLGYARYRALASLPPADPGLLELRGGQPYPLPLPGVDRQPMPSLLDAFEAAAHPQAPTGLAPEVRAALVDHLEHLGHKVAALQQEAELAPTRAAELRASADLLMARLNQVPQGVRRVELLDFQGETTVLELDPSLSPAANAEALYDRARKRARAAERLPARIRTVGRERDRLQTLLDALDEGTAEPAEVKHWVDRLRPGSGSDAGPDTRLPYRRYRSSGGLEIRVGRTGRANDELTFHHSSPQDVWLHARDVAGAHVILRWPDRSQNPPRRDLLEAAVLAALHSKARTASSVPVDWTRRKYVRSPRKAAPGVVLPDRVTTVFVRPDPAVEPRLRWDPPPP